MGRLERRSGRIILVEPAAEQRSRRTSVRVRNQPDGFLNGTKCGCSQTFGTVTITLLFSINAYGTNKSPRKYDYEQTFTVMVKPLPW